MHYVFIIMYVMVLNSSLRSVFDIVEQLIVLVLNLVFQGSALVEGHIVAVDVARVVAVLVKVMPEVLIVCVTNGRLHGRLWSSLVKMLIVDVMVLNSMYRSVFNIVE